MAWLHAVIDVPGDQHNAATGFWEQTLGWPVGAPWPGHPELRSFEPPLGTEYVHLQEIDGPPGVHLDMEAEARDATVSRAVRLGAVLVAEHDRWVTLRSPGGLLFCVVEAAEHEPPEPVVWPDGHRSRMVQVCIDSPAAVHDDEVVFWRALLPGRWASSDAREFAGKWHDDAGSPIQLLFQRLDEQDGSVRAHLDLGTDHRAAEVHRLLALGARDVGPGWAAGTSCRTWPTWRSVSPTTPRRARDVATSADRPGQPRAPLRNHQISGAKVVTDAAGAETELQQTGTHIRDASRRAPCLLDASRRPGEQPFGSCRGSVRQRRRDHHAPRNLGARHGAGTWHG